MFVRDDTPETGGHGREHVIQIQPRDDRVVHVEQQPEPVALAGQLLLCGANAFVVQHVVHRDGNLATTRSRKSSSDSSKAAGTRAAESHRSQRTHRRGQRQHAERLDPELVHQRRGGGEACRFLRVRTMTGCCVVKTEPLNDASTGTSSPAGSDRRRRRRACARA